MINFIQGAYEQYVTEKFIAVTQILETIRRLFFQGQGILKPCEGAYE